MDLNIITELADKIFVYRVASNISQKNMAKLCGVSEQTICNIENRKQNPSKLTKAKIEKVIHKGRK